MGVGLFMFMMVPTTKQKLKSLSSERVTIQIMSMRRDENAGYKRAKCIVGIKKVAPNGELIDRVEPVYGLNASNINVGDRIEMYYDEEDNSLFLPPGLFDFTGYLVIGVTLFIIVGGLGMLNMHAFLKRVKEEAYFIAEGKKVQATITGIRQVEDSAKKKYVLECTPPLPPILAINQFITDPIRRKPHQLVHFIKQSVTVYVITEETRKYYIPIEPYENAKWLYIEGIIKGVIIWTMTYYIWMVVLTNQVKEG